jgi:hypothetical protein
MNENVQPISMDNIQSHEDIFLDFGLSVFLPIIDEI